MTFNKLNGEDRSFMSEPIPRHPPEPDWDESRRLFELARDRMDDGNLQEAIRLFEESLRLKANYKTTLLLGDCLLRTHRFADAIVPLAAATTLNRQGIAPTLLAECWLKTGDPSRAKEMIDLALQRQPHYKRAQSLKVEIDAAVAAYFQSLFCNEEQ